VQPGAPAVERLVQAAVVAEQVVARVVGVDPQRVVVDVHVGERLGREGAAAVLALHEQHGAHPQVLGVGGVDPDVVVVVVRVRLEVVHVAPRGAGVVAPVDAAERLRARVHHAAVDLDHRVHGARLPRAHGEADAAHLAGGEAVLERGVGEPAPGAAAVCRLVDAAPGAHPLHARAAPAHAVPGAGVEHVGVGRVERELDGAGGVVHEERARPRAAAVGGLVDAALGVRRPEVA
jgi:hypothetical protein